MRAAISWMAPSLATCLMLPATPLAPARAMCSSSSPRAGSLVACLYENDGDMDDYEDALKRYKALGVLTDVGEDDPEDDDDDEVTTEQMVEWSKQKMEASGAGSRTTPVGLTMSSESASSATKAPKEFTVEMVDQVLDEVRPYLISDGGNVAVQSVDPSTMGVTLVLQGACGTCPSSTVTMKMGIERVLRENWPDLGAVMQAEPEADAPGGDGPAKLTVAMVEEVLAPIMPAIAGLGGTIAVLSAEGSTVRLEYTGPEKTKLGIKLALGDHVLIEQVIFV